MDDFFAGTLDGCGGVLGAGIAFAIAGILAMVMTNPFFAIPICGLVLLGGVGRIVEHLATDPAARHAEPGFDPATFRRLPDERVHVMNAVGLIFLMTIWILIVLRQFIPAVFGSVLVLLVWGIRIVLHPGYNPFRESDDFTLADYDQTVLITMGAGFTFVIAAAIVLAE
jgi:hypothetical protein